MQIVLIELLTLLKSRYLRFHVDFEKNRKYLNL